MYLVKDRNNGIKVDTQRRNGYSTFPSCFLDLKVTKRNMKLSETLSKCSRVFTRPGEVLFPRDILYFKLTKIFRNNLLSSLLLKRMFIKTHLFKIKIFKAGSSFK